MHEPPRRAYIRRRGRLTAGQARALATLRERYCVTPADVASEPPRGIEIGFGMGAELLDWARAAPGMQLLGIELYEPGVGALLARLAGEDLEHVRVVEAAAQDVLPAVPDGSIGELRIYFPDPWPKKRHHKRRLIQPEFVAELARVVEHGGLVRLATDWAPYAEWMRQCFVAEPRFINVVDNVRPAGVASVEDARSSTKFERRGEALGHDIHDLVYRRLPRG